MKMTVGIRHLLGLSLLLARGIYTTPLETAKDDQPKPEKNGEDSGGYTEQTMDDDVESALANFNDPYTDSEDLSNGLRQNSPFLPQSYAAYGNQQYGRQANLGQGSYGFAGNDNSAEDYSKSFGRFGNGPSRAAGVGRNSFGVGLPSYEAYLGAQYGSGSASNEKILPTSSLGSSSFTDSSSLPLVLPLGRRSQAFEDPKADFDHFASEYDAAFKDNSRAGHDYIDVGDAQVHALAAARNLSPRNYLPSKPASPYARRDVNEYSGRQGHYKPDLTYPYGFGASVQDRSPIAERDAAYGQAASYNNAYNGPVTSEYGVTTPSPIKVPYFPGGQQLSRPPIPPNYNVGRYARQAALFGLGPSSLDATASYITELNGYDDRAYGGSGYVAGLPVGGGSGVVPVTGTGTAQGSYRYVQPQLPPTPQHQFNQHASNAVDGAGISQYTNAQNSGAPLQRLYQPVAGFPQTENSDIYIGQYDQRNGGRSATNVGEYLFGENMVF